MKKHAVKHLFVLCLFWGYSEVLSAQLMKIVDCSVQLEQATIAFDQEKYDEVSQLLSYCADGELKKFSNLNKSERLQANHLLVMNYLKLKDQIGANTAMANLLKDFPGYKLTMEDPPAFQALYHQFDLNPVRSLEFQIGMTSPFFDLQTLHTFSSNPKFIEPPQYTGEQGISLAVYGHTLLIHRLYLYSGLNYQTNNFRLREEVRHGVFLHSEEQQPLLSVPLGWRYYFELGKVCVFPEISLAANFLLEANASMSGIDRNAERDLAEKQFDMRPLRKEVLWSGAIGAGINIPTSTKSIGVSLKYHTCFSSFTEIHPSSFELTRDYNFLENEVAYSYMSIHLFFMLHDYQPKKIKTK